jgi:hypothetical protein
MCTAEKTNDYDEKGTKINVPGNDIAKLMYYLKCICYILEMEQDPDIQHLTNFENYSNMSSGDIQKIVKLCSIASPDTLYNKFLFVDNYRNLGSLGNKLYERACSFNNSNGNIQNATDQQSFVRFMVFDLYWLERNFVIPFRNIVNEIEKKT